MASFHLESGSDCPGSITTEGVAIDAPPERVYAEFPVFSAADDHLADLVNGPAR